MINRLNFFLLLILAACTHEPDVPLKVSCSTPDINKTIQGTIQNQRYFDPKGIFSVQIPFDGECSIQELPLGGSSKDCFVSFESEDGKLLRFEILPNLRAQISLAQEESLKHLYEWIAAVLITQHTGSSLIQSGEVHLDMIGDAYYAIFAIPAVPLFINRCYILSYENDHLIVLSLQESKMLLGPERESELLNETIKYRYYYENI